MFKAIGEAEIAAVRRLYAQRCSRKRIARDLGLDPVQVGLLVRGLGLQRTACAGRSPITRIDPDFVRAWWPHASSRDIGAALNMSGAAVRALASRLGLPAHGPDFRPSLCPVRVLAA